MKQLLQDTRAEGAQMIGVVVGLMVSIVLGVLVWYKLSSGILYNGWIGGASTGRAGALAAANSTNVTADTIWTLFPIVGIVVIAGIILAIVTNFGRGNGA